MTSFRKRYLLIVLGALLLGFYLAPVGTLSLHDEIQQHLLEAEYGSATTFHFADKPNTAASSSESRESLIDKLKSLIPDIRWAAAFELANRRDRGAVEAIIRAMRDPDTVRVCVMAQALGRIKDPRALGPLTEAAFDLDNRDLRLCAIQSLGMLKDARAIPKLIEALETRNMPVAAADALARIGDERGVQPIINAAADNELTLWMVMALGELGSSQALPYLQTLSDNNKTIIKNSAQEARWKISRLSNNNAASQLSETLLTDKNSRYRSWAAFKLGELKSQQGINSLLHALNDADHEVSGRAAAAIIRLGEPALQPVRLELSVASNEQAYKYATAIIAYIGNQTDLQTLQIITKNSTTEIAHIAQHSIQVLQYQQHL